MFKMPANKQDWVRDRERERAIGFWRKKKCANLFIAYDVNEMHTTHRGSVERTNETKTNKKQAKTNGKQTNQFYSKQIAINFT